MSALKAHLCLQLWGNGLAILNSPVKQTQNRAWINTWVIKRDRGCNQTLESPLKWGIALWLCMSSGLHCPQTLGPQQRNSHSDGPTARDDGDSDRPAQNLCSEYRGHITLGSWGSHDSTGYILPAPTETAPLNLLFPRAPFCPGSAVLLPALLLSTSS